MNTEEGGIRRRILQLNNAGQGIHRQRLHLWHAGQGIHRTTLRDASGAPSGLYAWMQALAARLRYVRVCCGEWARICGPVPTIWHGLTGVFLDPPYGHAQGRVTALYTEDHDVTAAVLAWCQEWGAHPLLRIALCGYTGEYEVLATHGWRCHRWQAYGGYANIRKTGENRNRERECLWLSPHCVRAAGAQLALFAEE
jgi:DNA adenine methylase